MSSVHRVLELADVAGPVVAREHVDRRGGDPPDAKGGTTFGAEALIDAARKNLCSGRTRLRREAIEGTVHVFPLRRDGVLCGAIMSGDHRFYLRAPDRPEALDGVAMFTHLWLLKDGTWRIARVLSYDHGPAPYVSTRKAVAIPDPVLESLAGTYRTGQAPARSAARGERCASRSKREANSPSILRPKPSSSSTTEI